MRHTATTPSLRIRIRALPGGEGSVGQNVGGQNDAPRPGASQPYPEAGT